MDDLDPIDAEVHFHEDFAILLHVVPVKSMLMRSALILPVALFCCVWAARAQEGLSAGVKAPDFELPSISGKKIALREFLNKKVVIVHFWKSK